MKLFVFALLFVLTATSRAGAEDAVAQLTFHVTDDFGNAVPGAPVWMSTAVGWRPGGTEYGHSELRKANGLTDTNGLVTLKLLCKTGEIRYSVFVPPADRLSEKTMPIGQQAYYIDLGGEQRFTNVVDSWWQPWNPMVDIELKKVLNPIPMYTKRVEFSGDNNIPAQDEPVGFDLLRGDWVAPHGKGEIPDIVFALHREPEQKAMRYWGTQPRPYTLYDVTLSLGFSNNGDGIQSVFVAPGMASALRTLRYAPATGYLTNLVKHVRNTEDSVPQSDKREDQNYFFRVRTQTNDDGSIVSALYGKISGDVDVAPGGRIRFTYYLNPTPNDRNMEFDPSKNLFTNLSPSEQVREP
ncbi:MAG: Ig-like domain-containing protein [Kiritimatiellae bacterium]|nr:Ig-like domain-containing protein [Kiritimatiellia bacterium]